MGRVLTPDEITDADVAGGKAGHLAALTREGYPVPPWLALGAPVLRDLRARIAPELDAALGGLDPRDRAAVEAASARIGAAVRAAGLAEHDEDELVLRCDALFPPGARLAVRSSAVGEDSAEASFAGQLDSRLHVPLDEVVPAVLDVLASAWSPRALLYRRARRLEGRPVEAGVVIQLMVEARAAGVLFTVDPASGDADVAVLSAGLGLGEGVVADLVETDTWFLDKASGATRREAVRPKTQRVVADAERGTRLAPVPEDEQARPALSEAERAALLELGRKLEATRGAPQDVEWAVDGAGAPWLLQTRPVTALAGGRLRLFDNSNVVEGYPGVTTPLTYSFVRQGYEVIFRRSAAAFGVPAETIRANRAVFQHMVAFLDGRIYYDLLNWYRLYAMVPGFEERVRAWEAALGLPPRAEATEVSRTFAQTLASLPVRARALARVVRNLLRLDADVRRFKRRFDHVREQFWACDPDRRDAEGLVELYEYLLDELLGHWEITTVVDFYAFQLHAALGGLLTRWGLAGEGDLRNDLLCGEQGMESVEPVRSLLALAAQVRADEGLRALFASEPRDERVLGAILTRPEHEGFRAAFAAHADAFGDRTLQELKLETPTLTEAPHLLVAQLRRLLGSERSIEELEAREREVRAAAEATLAAALSLPRRALLGWVLRRTRAAVRHREDLRLARSRAFGLVKRLFRRLGLLLAEAGLLEAPADVFFLTVDEVIGAVRGSGVTRDLRALVRLRRAEHERFALQELPGRLQVRGIATARPYPAARGPSRVARELQGMGCAPGVVQARARVVEDPAGEGPIAGEVLVARQTDPGWVFLMVSAGGLVVERGSLLSHTAIIGRELGIPTVVGVAGATEAIHSGDLVELDGLAGTVRVLERAPQPPAEGLAPPAGARATSSPADGARPDPARPTFGRGGPPAPAGAGAPAGARGAGQPPGGRRGGAKPRRGKRGGPKAGPRAPSGPGTPPPKGAAAPKAATAPKAAAPPQGAGPAGGAPSPAPPGAPGHALDRARRGGAAAGPAPSSQPTSSPPPPGAGASPEHA